VAGRADPAVAVLRVDRKEAGVLVAVLAAPAALEDLAHRQNR